MPVKTESASRAKRRPRFEHQSTLDVLKKDMKLLKKETSKLQKRLMDIDDTLERLSVSTALTAAIVKAKLWDKPEKNA